jgi:hypothetical protein
MIQIGGIIPSELKLVSYPCYCTFQGDSLFFNEKPVGSFCLEKVDLSFQAQKIGVLNFSPKVVYQDTSGIRIISKINSINLTINQSSSTENTEKNIRDKSQTTFLNNDQIKCELRTAVSLSTFEYLIDSFIADYMHYKLSPEKSGWRTLTEIIGNARIPKSSVYGANCRKGRVLLELEARGLVEVRMFKGERGRGGRITKVRICYEKDPLKHLVEQRVLKNK